MNVELWGESTPYGIKLSYEYSQAEMFSWKLIQDTEPSKARTVPVPLHDELIIGTLRNIADLAGAKDFDRFCEWIDDNH